MSNKQTAVDWLESEFERQCLFSAFAYEDEAYFRSLLEQAKSMNNYQHGLTFARGVMTGYANANGHESVDFEQYFEKTYGK